QLDGELLDLLAREAVDLFQAAVGGLERGGGSCERLASFGEPGGIGIVTRPGDERLRFLLCGGKSFLAPAREAFAARELAGSLGLVVVRAVFVRGESASHSDVGEAWEPQFWNMTHLHEIQLPCASLAGEVELAPSSSQ